MKKAKRKIIIKKLHLPIENYAYDVQLITSVDGGKNYYYCGFGKFAKTLTEARKIKKQLLAQC